jgi:hypothetical protein
MFRGGSNAVRSLRLLFWWSAAAARLQGSFPVVDAGGGWGGADGLLDTCVPAEASVCESGFELLAAG